MAMRRRTLPAITITVLAFAALSAQQTPPRDRVVAGHGAIRGRVTTVDGQPLPRASIHLEGERSAYTAVTNPDGEYEVPEIATDNYRVTAALTGYVIGEHGAAVDTAGVPVRVDANETLDHIDVVLTFGAIIDGRVVDESRRPLSGAAVDALYAGTVRGQRLLTLAVGAITNDAGQFRLSGLRPGAYVIRASPAANASDVAASGNGYTATYYPGVASPSRSTAITVTAAGRVNAIDFPVVVVPAAAISGRLLLSDGAPAGGLEMVRSSRRLRIVSNTLQADVERTVTATDGSFTFQNVRPGKYLLTNESSGGESVRQNVLVAGSDVVGLQLIARRAVSIAGAVVTDENKPPPFPAEPVRIGLVSPNAGSIVVLDEETAKELDADWTFFGTVMGPVLLRPTPLPDGWDVLRVEIDGGDFTDQVFPALDKNEAHIRIVIGRADAARLAERGR